MNYLTAPIAAVALALLALAAQADTPTPAPADKPAQAQADNSNLLALGKPEMLLKTEPSAAGSRGAAAPAPLTRADVIKELQRARAAGELNWHDREVTGFMR